MILPPFLRPGDTIRVVAPSGPFESDLLNRGLERLSQFNVVTPAAMWGRRSGFFAGSELERLSELQTALDDVSCHAILLARGGYGLGPLLPQISWDIYREVPRWIVGFSDATVLHAHLAKIGIASIHAGNGTTLANAEEREIKELARLLQGEATEPFTELEIWSAGVATGPLFGGNLTVLFAEAASGRLMIPPGAILLLEDVTETSYRIDRMLCALYDGGHLSRVAGVVLGEFTDCSSGKFEVATESVLRERLARLGVPVASGLPVGHGKKNAPMMLGALMSLNTENRSLTMSRPRSA